jgi:hypothetical protein
MHASDRKEQMNREDADKTESSGETRSGTPNPQDDPNKVRSTEHKSGYGGEGGKPRTSSDDRKQSDD